MNAISNIAQYTAHMFMGGVLGYSFFSENSISSMHVFASGSPTIKSADAPKNSIDFSILSEKKLTQPWANMHRNSFHDKDSHRFVHERDLSSDSYSESSEDQKLCAQKLHVSLGACNEYGVYINRSIGLSEQLINRLSLSNNVSSWQNVTPSMLTAYAKLDLSYHSGSKIESLKKYDFDGFSELLSLEFMGNSFHRLDSGVFEGASGLEILALSGLPLTMISDDVFDHLPYLVELRLDGTSLRLSESNYRGLMSKSQFFKLYYSDTDLGGNVTIAVGSKSIPVANVSRFFPHGETDFEGLGEASFILTGDGLRIDLGQEITPSQKEFLCQYYPELSICSTLAQKACQERLDVPIYECNKYGVFINRSKAIAKSILDQLFFVHSWREMPPEILKLVTSVRVIRSDLNSIKEHDFDGLPHLSDLYLGDNHLTQLSLTPFLDIPNLKKLFLDSNQISKIQKGVFNHLKNLRLLDLALNELRELPEDCFDELDLFTELYLSGNNLTLTEHQFKSLLGKEKNLKLSYKRPFSDCEVSIEVNNRAMQISDVKDFFNFSQRVDGTSYIYPNQIQKVDLIDQLSRDQFDFLCLYFSEYFEFCHLKFHKDHTALIIGVGLAVLFVGIATVGLLSCCLYRRCSATHSSYTPLN